jgi:hypothetical protein
MVRAALLFAAAVIGALSSEPDKYFRYIQMTAYNADVPLPTVIDGQLAGANACGGFTQLAMGSSLEVSGDVAASYGLGTPGLPPLGFQDSAEFVPAFTKVVDFRSEQDFVDHIACLKPIIANYSRDGETWKSKFQYYVQTPPAFMLGTLMSVEELFWDSEGSHAMQDVSDLHEEFTKAYDWETGSRTPIWHAHGGQIKGMADPGYTGFEQAVFGSVTAYSNAEEIRRDYEERQRHFGRINQIVAETCAQQCKLPTVAAAVFNASWVLQGDKPFILV